MADTEVQKPQGDSTWYEPDSQAANSAYPHTHGFYSNSGHLVEMDDTPGSERIRIQHRIGNYTEIQSDGTEIHKITGDSYEITVKNNHVYIEGYCSVVIKGDSKLSVEGNVYQNIQGNVYQNVEGEMDAFVSGEVNISSESDVNITAGGLSGQIYLNAPLGVFIDSDVTIKGSLSTTGYIACSEDIVASKKVFGALGLVTPVGVLVGLPDPLTIPPGITSAFQISSLVSVTAPILNDVYGPVALFRTRYTMHTHAMPPYGFPTSSPSVGGL